MRFLNVHSEYYKSYVSRLYVVTGWILQLIARIATIPKGRILQFRGRSQTVFAINRYAIYQALINRSVAILAQVAILSIATNQTIVFKVALLSPLAVSKLGALITYCGVLIRT